MIPCLGTIIFILIIIAGVLHISSYLTITIILQWYYSFWYCVIVIHVTVVSKVII